MKNDLNRPEHMGSDSRLRTAHPRIIHQCHDSETLIIDLDTGHYYCLEGTASWIWEAAVAGASAAQIAEALGRALSLPSPGDMCEIVLVFIRELISEDLLAVDHDTPRRPAAISDPFLQVASDNGSLEYRPPQLSKFTDLAELLLADPIHEIDVLAGAEVR